MAVNIIKHGFKDTKDHFIDIKIILDGDKTKLRIRDDGKEFNPLDYMKKQDKDKDVEDALSNIGIKIVKDLARTVDYRYTMRLNNLFVELVDEKFIELPADLRNWQKAEQFIRQIVQTYSPSVKVLERVILASEELFAFIAENAYEDNQQGNIGIRVKPLESGVSVNFLYKGKLGDITKLDDNEPLSVGLKIVKKSTDIFSYSKSMGKNNITVCKYW